MCFSGVPDTVPAMKIIKVSGGRLVTILLQEMLRRGERYLLATLCIGGGKGLVALFEMV